jgi:Chaperone of endosialidase
MTYGNNNIDVGNEGVATEGGTIRVGTPGTQTATYIAGIENAKITGAAVSVTPSGQLGVLASSERYKTAIAPMSADTEKLQRLRPVSSHLKSDPNGAVQYGLIAEEVATVYPELVIRDAGGTIQGVRYDELAPMLLNEVQKQQQVNSVQAAKIASLERQLPGIQAALLKLQPKDELLAQR